MELSVCESEATQQCLENRECVVLEDLTRTDERSQGATNL